MNEMVVPDRPTKWNRSKALLLDRVSSPITRRVYNRGLDEFIAWFRQEPRPAGFAEAMVTAGRVALEARKRGPVSINVWITAAADWRSKRPATDWWRRNWREEAPGSGASNRTASTSGTGCRSSQAQTLLNAPDARTKKGLRDRAMFAALVGCELRRSELANLTVEHVQQLEGRWCIVDLVGKHGRVRTIPVPSWVKNAIDSWTAAAAVTEGHLFRPINRGDQVRGLRMSQKVVWQMLKTYVAGASYRTSRRTIFAGRRRSCAGRRAASWSSFTAALPLLGTDDGAVFGNRWR